MPPCDRDTGQCRRIGWILCHQCLRIQSPGWTHTDHAARKIYGNHGIVAGAVNPLGRAVVVRGGFHVTGRWPYCSGIGYCTWVIGACVVHEGSVPRMTSLGTPEIRFFWFPKTAVEVIDTWHVSGLRGSGSHDVEVGDLFVPDEHCTLGYAAPAVNRHAVPGSPGEPVRHVRQRGSLGDRTCSNRRADRTCSNEDPGGFIPTPEGQTQWSVERRSR